MVVSSVAGAFPGVAVVNPAVSSSEAASVARPAVSVPFRTSTVTPSTCGDGVGEGDGEGEGDREGDGVGLVRGEACVVPGRIPPPRAGPSPGEPLAQIRPSSRIIPTTLTPATTQGSIRRRSYGW